MEKVLDKICELDPMCEKNVENARQNLWPDYHAEAAKQDEEQARMEADAKKKKAKVRPKYSY